MDIAKFAKQALKGDSFRVPAVACATDQAVLKGRQHEVRNLLSRTLCYLVPQRK